MPHIDPNDVMVDWPSDEGVIGVVGIAPWATIDFLSQVYNLVSAEKDWHFPRIIMDANSKIPSRGRYFDLGETDPSPYIADTIDELILAGATTIVVPCNTAHILFDRWSHRAPGHIINIIDATLSDLLKLNPEKIAVLGSANLALHRTYLKPLSSEGLTIRMMSEDEQQLLQIVINEIKISNLLTINVKLRLEQLFIRLNQENVDTLILGCTELAQAVNCIDNTSFTGKIVDSNAALAKAALERTMKANKINGSCLAV